MRENWNFRPFAKIVSNWSSGYGRRLKFDRSRVQILAPVDGPFVTLLL